MGYLSLAMALLTMTLGAGTQAGYVDLFRDANYQNKLTRINNIVVDRCYNLACGDMNNVVTSAKWSDLPEKRKQYSGMTLVAFYASVGCPTSATNWWPTDAQSSDYTGFPSDFRQYDGLGNAISSFMVIDGPASTSRYNFCFASWGELGRLNATNDTTTDLIASTSGDLQ